MSRRAWLAWTALHLLLAGFWALSAWTDSYCWFGNDCAAQLAAPLRRIAWWSGLYWALGLNAGWWLIWALRRRRYAVVVVCAAALLAAWPAKAGLRRLLAPDYYAIFQFERVAEEYVTDVVALGGAPMAPYLLRSARTPGARQRRRALTGLGQLNYQPAVPVLDSILRNPQEPDFVRADALQALRRMPGARAQRAVRQFGQPAGHDAAAQAVVRLADAWMATD